MKRVLLVAGLLMLFATPVKAFDKSLLSSAEPEKEKITSEMTFSEVEIKNRANKAETKVSKSPNNILFKIYRAPFDYKERTLKASLEADINQRDVRRETNVSLTPIAEGTKLESAPETILAINLFRRITGQREAYTPTSGRSDVLQSAKFDALLKVGAVATEVTVGMSLQAYMARRYGWQPEPRTAEKKKDYEPKHWSFLIMTGPTAL